MNEISYEKEMERAIERCNKEYIELLNSKEYQLGRKLNKIVASVKRFDFAGVVKMFRNTRIQKRINRNFTDFKSKENVYYGQGEIVKLEGIRTVVYSCIVGGYDELNPPYVCTPNIEYVIFSEKELSIPGWKCIKIPIPFNGLEDPTLINRYIKMHPSEILSDYDIAIYVDGKVNIIADLSSIVGACKVDVGIAMHRHVSRNNIYNEIQACILYGKGNPIKLRKQADFYKSSGFPDDYGLLEATIIVYDLNNSNQKHICNEWWDEFIRSESKRDQISLPFILWKMGYRIEDVGSLGTNLYRNPKFRIASIHK